jgi:hypothetical protein
MLVVETIAKIRRAHFVEGKSIKQICRELRVSRNTVRKVIRSGATEFTYDRTTQPRPKIDPWRTELDAMLAENARAAEAGAPDAIRIYEELRNRGYDGGYDAVRRYAAGWSKGDASEASASAYVPLSFDPGEAYQFDWSHEIVILLDGVTVDGEGRPCPALPQPDAVRAGLSARDAGDGVRCPRQGVRLLRRRLRAGDLRQHEDGGGHDLRRQGPRLQSPLPADVRPLPRRSGRLHAGVGLGEGAGREPGGRGPPAVLHAAAARSKATPS